MHIGPIHQVDKSIWKLMYRITNHGSFIMKIDDQKRLDVCGELIFIDDE